MKKQLCLIALLLLVLVLGGCSNSIIFTPEEAKTMPYAFDRAMTPAAIMGARIAGTDEGGNATLHHIGFAMSGGVLDTGHRTLSGVDSSGRQITVGLDSVAFLQLRHTDLAPLFVNTRKYLAEVPDESDRPDRIFAKGEQHYYNILNFDSFGATIDPASATLTGQTTRGSEIRVPLDKVTVLRYTHRDWLETVRWPVALAVISAFVIGVDQVFGEP